MPAAPARRPVGIAQPAAALAAADEERLRRYATALALSEGPPPAGAGRRDEPRLSLNYARALVRKTAAYVFPGPVTFRTPPGAGPPAAAARAETALAALVADLDLAALDVGLCMDAAVLGDAAVKITWDARAAAPLVVPVDPATLAVGAAADDPRRMLTATQRYGLPPTRLRELGWLAAGHEPPHDAPLEIVERWTPARWQVEVAGQLVRDEANPYGWLPYVVLPNAPRPHQFWGESDLIDLGDLCHEIERRVGVLSRVLDLSGAPIAVLENVDGADGIGVRPGAVWELPEGARAYLLDLLSGGGAELHVRYLDLLFRALHDLSETPRTAFGDAGRNLSGAALEVEVQPLLQKVARKRRGWDAFYRERNTRLLDLLERHGGQPLGGVRRTEAIWPSVLPSDVDGAVRNAALLVREGIHSRRTAIATLGGADPDGEFARVRHEAAAIAAPGPLAPAAPSSEEERAP
ncbi:MAG: phage portal protein [Thermomicrobiales bacterium]|nr:phage portal protein [Thermomicrobiales bacterium]